MHGAVVTFSDVTPLHVLQEQREDLLRTISHDLRNPLTLVQGHAQMLHRQVTRSGADRSLLRSAGPRASRGTVAPSASPCRPARWL
ncbi:MAG: hypothetical protein HY690_14125 [Chloroflexi bacterium]|nr:hypothetical protein [Chloroflexota bacterium]